MSETAKQGTTKAPAQATESQAAETVPAATVPAATVPAATVPAATESDATQSGGRQEPAAEHGGTPQASSGEHAEPDIDETKRKFREALERKNQVHNEGQGKGGRDGGKINGAHGPAASRRSFRRKSG